MDDRQPGASRALVVSATKPYSRHTNEIKTRLAATSSTRYQRRKSLLIISPNKPKYFLNNGKLCTNLLG